MLLKLVSSHGSFFLTLASFVLFRCGFAVAAEDWPMWRGDASRSAAVDNEVPSELGLQWTRHFAARKQAWDDALNLDLMTYDRVFEPIVVDGLLCMGFNDQGKLVALDADTGETRWTYYAEAPVRLPPVGWNNKIYFCSDDGFLYCVNANDGSLHWKFRGAPNSQHAIGNQRLISAWPARGGPVVYDGKVYFAASIWPFMGTFIYSLDAETGTIDWVNDRTGSQYIKQPHSAPSFAGVAPQGAMVATEDLLIVPGGRSVPAVFDRHTGDLKYFEINAGGKGTGGSFVSADALHFYVHTRENRTRAFNLESGRKTAFMPNEAVLADGFLYSAESSDDRSVISAYDVRYEEQTAREPIWEVKAKGKDDLILAGDMLVAAEGKRVSLVQIPSAHNELNTPQLQVSFDVAGLDADETIARLLVAAGKLFVVGDAGTICAFGSGSVAKRGANVVVQQKAIIEKSVERRERAAFAESLFSLGSAEGYAFWFGPADSPALMSVVDNSPFVQLAVVDHDHRRADALRKQLDELGILGRVTVHTSAPESFRAPKYVAHMVFVSSEIASSNRALAEIYKSVRPYGGTLVLLDDSNEREIKAGDLERIESLKLEQAECKLVSLATDSLRTNNTSQREKAIVVSRMGALPGAADWTHQYGDVANTVKSNDSRVKLPLGILWFGGSSNMDVLPRHGHGPPEQVVGGRLFIQGMNSLSARDVYTGRVLWKREFKDLGTFDIYYDLTYENTPLDPKYNQVHIPGANGRGTNYVVTEDRIYLLVGATCLMLDPATGKEVGTIKLPANDDGSLPEWGYIGIYDDVLMGGIGFANYRKRYELEFESDKELKSNKAGFGTKSIDRAASRALVGFDRHTGKQLWRQDASHSFWHNGIVAGGGQVYCLDKNPTKIEEAMRRRGISLPDSYRILCLDIKSGDVQWEIKEGIFGTWLGYSAQHELLLQAGAQASDRLTAEIGQGMRVYHAESGELHWKKDDLDYAGPCILHNDLIITNANSYSESSGAFYLTTGKQKMVKHPLTGKVTPWTMTRAYGCNNIIASENLLTFRSGAAGYYDLTTDSGTGNLGGFKSGCTSNLVVANGVLNAPDYTRTCSCAYQNQTSLALVHMPDVEVWSVNALANVLDKKVALANESKNGTLLESVGFNLGAAGDRRDQAGVLWLEYPVKAGASPPFKVKFNSDAKVYAQHSASRKEDPRAWISASGIENVRELTLGLKLVEEIDLAKGVRISHADDDAEESEKGEVDLSSSDLEMTLDDVAQTIGLRFETVPLPNGSRIKKAYLQFTCDDPSESPTSLWIAGELSPKSERFTDSSHDVTSRNKTTTEVPWSPRAWKKTGESGRAQRSPDISRIVSEIVSQSEWKTGSPMTFVVSGEGKRTAHSSQGANKEATKLVVIAESIEVDQMEPAHTDDYEVELIFAPPRGSRDTRVFDVYAQDTLVASDVEVKPGDGAEVQPPTVLLLPRVAIGDRLLLRFDAKHGSPVISGVRLAKQAD